MVIRSVLSSLGSSQRQILYFGQRRDYKGDGVSPSVVLRLSTVTVYRVEMLRSYLRASPSGAQAHRIHILYATASIVCTVLYLYTVLYTHMI